MLRTKMFPLNSCPKWTLKQGQVRREIFETHSWPSSYVPEESAQVFYKSDFSVSIVSCIWNWQFSSLEPDRPVARRPPCWLWYRSSVSRVFIQSHNIYIYIFGARFKRFIVSFFFTFLKLSWVCNCLIPGALEFLKITVENWSFVVTVSTVNRI